MQVSVSESQISLVKSKMAINVSGPMNIFLVQARSGLGQNKLAQIFSALDL